MALGLALGSGGARGWCHIGVLGALERQGISPQVVAGCSMGALVGAAWAGGRLPELEAWAKALTLGRMFQESDPTTAGGGLLNGASIARVLGEIGLPERIEDLDRPFLAVATDMESGREVWLQRGSLVDAVRASVSIPGVFRPHHYDGRWLLDGGLVNPVPVSACRALGARRVIAVNPNGKGDGPLWSSARRPDWRQELIKEKLPGVLPPSVLGWLHEQLEPQDEQTAPTTLEVVSVSIDIMTEYLRATRAAADPADLSLAAELNTIEVLDLHRADDIIAAGEALVLEAQEQGQLDRFVDR